MKKLKQKLKQWAKKQRHSDEKMQEQVQKQDQNQQNRYNYNDKQQYQSSISQYQIEQLQYQNYYQHNEYEQYSSSQQPQQYFHPQKSFSSQQQFKLSNISSKLQYKLEYLNKNNIIQRLPIHFSKQLLDDYYDRYIKVIHCFVEFDKMLYFRKSMRNNQNKLNSNHNCNAHIQNNSDNYNFQTLIRQSSQNKSTLYNKHIKWMLLDYDLISTKQLKKQENNLRNMYNNHNHNLKGIIEGQRGRQRQQQMGIKRNVDQFQYYMIEHVYALMDNGAEMGKQQKREKQMNMQPQNKQKMQQQKLIHQITLSDNQQHQHTLLYNQFTNTIIPSNYSFLNIQHYYYYLYHNNNTFHFHNNNNIYNFDNFSIEVLEFLKVEDVRLFIKRSKEVKKYYKEIERNVNKDNNKENNKDNNKSKKIDCKINKQQKLRLIKIPVRGKYCRHLDFYDLEEIYQMIFKNKQSMKNMHSQNRTDQQFQCPKCSIMIKFNQLMYLNEVQILIQMIKLFYLDIKNTENIVNESIKKLNNYRKINKKSSQRSYRQYKNQRRMDQQHQHYKNQQYLNKQNIFLSQQSKIESESYQTELQDIRLLVDHERKTCKLKVKYYIKIRDQWQQKQKQKQQQQKHKQMSYLNTDIQYNHQENFQQYSTNSLQYFTFQQTLVSQIYSTLTCPSLQFGPLNNLKLKKTLLNFGKSSIKIRQQDINKKLLEDGENNIVEFKQRYEIWEMVGMAKESIKRRKEVYKGIEDGTLPV